MSVWNVRSVEDEPEIILHRWVVFELPNGDRHFVGWCGEGRVSSKIMEFDPITMRGVTRSSRVYQLMGPPGTNLDAMYVWGHWKRINGVTEAKDVSAEIAKNVA